MTPEPDTISDSDLVARSHGRMRIPFIVLTATLVAATFSVTWMAFRSPSSTSAGQDSATATSEAMGPCGTSNRVITRLGSEQGDTSNLDVILVDGSCAVIEAIAADPTLQEYYGALSRSGERVAYVSGATDASARRLIITDVKTLEETQLLDSSRLIGGLAWSPDDKWVAFWQEDGQGHPGIWRVNVDNGVTELVSQGQTAEVMPEWSPDGDQIAFVKADPQGSQIAIWQGLEGERPLKVDGALSYPAWSPDGLVIAAVRDQDDSIVVLDVATGSITMEVRLPRSLRATDLEWSSAGPLLALDGQRFDEVDMWLLDMGTKRWTQLGSRRGAL